jgi:hypothetical protein
MRLILILPLMLSACSDWPQLDDTLTPAAREAPFPALTPVPPAPTSRADESAALQARIAALQARAAMMR